MTNKKLNAVIIGAGSIGALKDDKYDDPNNDEQIHTWAHACIVHKNINLIAISDIDYNKAGKAGKKWNCMYTDTILNVDPHYDIIIVCIDTKHHYEYLKKLLPILKKHNNTSACIIIEKPFCETLEQATEIMKLYLKENIKVIINYTRRFDQSTYYLKDLIDTGKTGKIWGCNIKYNRGLLRDGCHAIDLCNYLFGNILEGNILSGQPINDFSDEDLTYTIYMRYEKCDNVFMLPIDGRVCSIFEFDIFTEKGRFRFIDHGLRMEVYKYDNEKNYGNYDSMDYDKVIKFKTELNNCLMNALDSAVGIKKFNCTMMDAVQTHIIINLLKIKKEKINV